MEMKETYSSGKVGFPISKETDPTLVDGAIEMFEKNGYRIELVDKDDKTTMFNVGLMED